MPRFTQTPDKIITREGKDIHVFNMDSTENLDRETVASFGEEWKKFNKFDPDEIEKIGNDYFDILPSVCKSKDMLVMDVGCGSGRWAVYLAPFVKEIECIDPSVAVHTAAKVLGSLPNTRVSQVDIDNIPFADDSFDLVYSLGVLHHIPDTALAMKKCVQKVKHGGHFLVYLYYSLDNRGHVYKSIFNVSAVIRKFISTSRPGVKKVLCDFIALTVYYPVAKSAHLLNKMGAKRISKKIPLSYYGDKSFWIMKNDALDRFGTPLEQRFSKKEIEQMMQASGLTNIVFSEKEPYWHAIGQKL